MLKQEMQAACVKTRQIADAELKEWLNKETLLTADFRRRLTFNTTALSQTQRDTITGRDLPSSYNQEAFWLVHALGAFDIDDEINDSSSSNI
ncbi:MAG: hypothetical protein IJO46_08240, partial [Thermoguttaceae bacterium]|nr:hypothetical protein [Thermoguttaceae bacterium]